MESVTKLTRDLRRAAGGPGGLKTREVRYLVDLYYQMQRNRIRAAHQIRSGEKDDEETEPHELLTWALDQFETVEKQIPGAMKVYAESTDVGRWLLSIHGIGPVLAAGLLAHIDIERAQTVGAIWRFAGLDPTLKWKAKTKRPWNARLKTLCWKVGDSFVKQRNSEKDTYGKIYDQRKAQEVSRNTAGDFKDQAAETLEVKRITDKKTKEIYESGKLPDGRIDLRARRYAVKLFLSHLHHVMYEVRYSKLPPKPYILTKPDHAHFYGPPNWPLTVAAESTVGKE